MSFFRVRAAVPALLDRPDVWRQGGGRRRGSRLGTSAQPPLLAGGHNQIPHHEEGHQKVTQGETDDQYQSGFFPWFLWANFLLPPPLLRPHIVRVMTH